MLPLVGANGWFFTVVATRVLHVGRALAHVPVVVAEVAPPVAARRVVGEVVAGRVEGARGLAVLGAREVVDEARGEAAAARRVEAGPRRRRYEGEEEYGLPHLRGSSPVRGDDDEE